MGLAQPLPARKPPKFRPHAPTKGRRLRKDVEASSSATSIRVSRVTADRRRSYKSKTISLNFRDITIKSESKYSTASHRVNDRLQMLPFSFEVRSIDDFGHQIDLVTRVAARDNGQPLNVTFHLPIARSLGGPARDAEIHRLVLWALTHELNETLRTADGAPLVEPHPHAAGYSHPELEAMGVAARYADEQARPGWGAASGSWLVSGRTVKV